jgi:hypothetical protein
LAGGNIAVASKRDTALHRTPPVLRRAFFGSTSGNCQAAILGSEKSVMIQRLGLLDLISMTE